MAGGLWDMPMPNQQNMPRQAGVADLIGGLTAGQNVGSGLLESLLKGQMYQQAQRQNQEAMLQDQALKAYQQTGNPQEAGAISPKTGMMLEDRDRVKLEKGIQLHDEMKSNAYGNLDYYKNTYRPAMIKAGIPPALLPEYNSTQELNEGLYKKEQLAAVYKKMGFNKGPRYRKLANGMILDSETGKTISDPNYTMPVGPGQVVQPYAEGGPKFATAPATESQKLTAAPKGEGQTIQAYVDDYQKRNPKASYSEAFAAYHKDKQTGKVLQKGASTVGADALFGPSGGGGNQPMEQLPDASAHKDRVIKDTTTGKRLKSDGKNWKPI